MTDAKPKKPRKPKPIVPPNCAHCGQPAQPVEGWEIYGPWSRFAKDPFWACRPCKAYVGSHPNGKPLGRPADQYLRAARIKLHERFDAIWREAPAEYEIESDKQRVIILSTARARTYAYLGEIMGLDKAATHIAMFDLEQCREAWVALNGLRYAAVRRWAKGKKDD